MGVRWIAFHVTDACQLNCKHCLRDPELKAHHIELGLVRRMLDQAAGVYGIRHVALTGGEPSLHPEFDEILDAIVERGMTWHCVTNAVRFDKRLLKMLEADPRRREALSALDFSLDGATEAVHDRIRGEGSFRDVMRAVALSKMRDIPFVLQMTLNALNVHELEAFAIMAAELGAERASYNFLQPTGTYLDAEMYLSHDAWRRVQDRIERVAAILTIPIVGSEGFAQPQHFHECEPWKSEVIHVDYKGLMNLCCLHAGVPGHTKHGRSDAIADMNHESLIEGHVKMLDLVQHARLAKLEAMAKGTLDDRWDKYPCNWCMEHFGKPFWTDEGAAGEPAKRERWRGAWAPENHEGTSVPVSRRLAILP
ncbi:MAG: radical SAM protein [Deltaproteobacteria bacterium]|nr:radical SAM protein [Deltaproteobacteria bacterium]